MIMPDLVDAHDQLSFVEQTTNNLFNIVQPGHDAFQKPTGKTKSKSKKKSQEAKLRVYVKAKKKPSAGAHVKKTFIDLNAEELSLITKPRRSRKERLSNTDFRLDEQIKEVEVEEIDEQPKKMRRNYRS